MGAAVKDPQSKINERYGRQILFAPIGPDGQAKLLDSRVLIVGCGALGCAQAEMLARAGVGHLRIVDRDFVEFTNLQRQTLFKEADAGDRLPKSVAAKNRLNDINSDIEIEAIVDDVNNSNVEAFIHDCDLVIDGTDNFQVRYLLNDACIKTGIIWIYGAAVSSYGTTMTVIPGETPCLRCIFDEIPDAGSSPTCDTAGVIMSIIQTVAAMQVTETLKILVGDHGSLHRSLMQFDVWTNERHAISLDVPDPDCPCCGKHKYEFLDGSSEFAELLCGRDAVQIAPPSGGGIDLSSLATRLEALGEVKQNEYLLRFANGKNEITVFRDGRAIIKGTDDVPTARSLYARFIGT
jgi:molybdopterin/thiamine biosynthesis adenylyltransferase